MIVKSLLVFLAIVSLSGNLAFADFSEVRPGKKFRFPYDHGTHNGYPVEWWYFTGHLEGLGEKQRTFGFELTFFRVAINSLEIRKESPWHVQSLFLAHAALTDDQGQRFLFQKKTARPNFGQSGAEEGQLHVWLDNWSVKMDGKTGYFDLEFYAKDRKSKDPFSVKLQLSSKKAPVLQGKDGYSQKGKEESDASYYVAFTRLLGKGSVLSDGVTIPVKASAWMDHEVLSSQPNDSEVGWDWFAIQLDNNWECMIYHLKRGPELKTSSFSAGSCISPSGEKKYLSVEDYSIRALSQWKSSATNISYPGSWQVQIPKLNIDLKVIPTLAHQELADEGAASRSYWEGRSTVTGQMADKSVEGSAYVELVGYTPTQ